MAHTCPACGEICYCNGDWDDAILDYEEDILSCEHCLENDELFDDCERAGHNNSYPFERCDKCDGEHFADREHAYLEIIREDKERIKQLEDALNHLGEYVKYGRSENWYSETWACMLPDEVEATVEEALKEDEK